jgi:uncharacterized protein (TIGR02453 family)
MPFDGFGPGTLQFLFELSFNNNREWFAENRDRYDAVVRKPAEAFILDLGERLSRTYPTVVYDTRRNGAGSLMRIHRDVRFSPDKRPLKENVGIIFPLAPGKKVEVPIFYFHIALDGCFFYGGQHVFTPEALSRYRSAVADERTGPALVRILADLESAGLASMEDPAYKRTPRGYPADHPRAALLRQAALGAGLSFSQEDLGRSDLVDRCAAAAEAMEPLADWLGAMNARSS